jgi:hypothetical protein
MLTTPHLNGLPDSVYPRPTHELHLREAIVECEVSRSVMSDSIPGPAANTARPASPDAGPARITPRRGFVFLRTHPEVIVAGALFIVLVATSSQYGWHRDELYFVVAGQHPAWGYPDQPLLTPLLTAALNALGHGSLVVVRLASAAASAATALLTGIMAGQLGGTPRARAFAATAWAVSAISLVTGHFVDTTTFDILATVAVCSCILQAITADSERWMIAAGAVLGFGLLNKMTIGFVIAVVCGSLLAFGPRRMLFTRSALIGATLAVLGAAPYVIWQSLNGWPQVALAHSIAGSGAEGGRVGVIPFQLLLISPLLAPVWIAGIVRLFRNPQARIARAFAVAYLVVLVVIIATSGKAYYAAGLLPICVASGAIATDEWVRRRRSGRRLGLVAGALGLAFVINAAIGLAVLPVQLLTPTGIERINPDAGEQVGWPQFTASVATAFDAIPDGQRSTAVIFTGNYGEAGAIDRYGGALGLPKAFSGHNGFALWGPPTTRGPVVVVGLPGGPALARYFSGCHVVTHVDNGFQLDNDEQGDAVRLCSGPVKPWATLWPELVHYG